MQDKAQKNVLTISLSNHLTNEPITEIIAQDWSKTDTATRARFHNIGFDVDPTDTDATLRHLQETITKERWDGLLVGWCTRGYPERTELFEQIMNTCVEAKGPETKMMFCTGPKNLVEATLRSFP